MRIPAGLLCLVATLPIGSASPAAGQEWTRFRGPNGTGLSDATTIPTEWTLDDYDWRVQLPGTGHSSPVLWGDKIFLTSADEKALVRYALCYSAVDGSELWRREYPFTLHDRHKFNSFASATPAVDEERVYFVWSTPSRYTLFALDHEGQDVWERDLGPYESQHSCGTSPIVYEDLVILGNDQDGPSSLFAVDRCTGETRWRVPRKNTNVAYSTPCVWQREGAAPQILFNSNAHGITGINPLTGETIWEAGGVFDKRSCSSPVVVAGLVIGTCGSGGHASNYVVAVNPGTAAHASPEVAYRIEDGTTPYVPTPLAKGDLLFLWGDTGTVSCVHAPTGEIVWDEHVGDNYFGSPVCVHDRLYCLSDAGECVVLAAGEVFEELARNPLGEYSHSTPAVAGGKMYLRTVSWLMSIGGKEQIAAE